MNETNEIVEVALDSIIPNRFQPRLTFDEQSLNELAKSIRQHGIIQPLVLRRIGDKYEIIAGERRYKASYIAGLTKVPAIVINLNDNESAEVAIVENLQREDLSPIEEAKSYKKLLDRGYITQDKLAVRMGKTQATISNKLRLLNLDEQIQEALLNNKISERHARSLLRLTNKEDQVELLNEIIKRRLNVRLTEEAINARLNGQSFKDYFNSKKEEPQATILEVNNKPENELDLININNTIPSVKTIEEPKEKDQFFNPSFKQFNQELPHEETKNSIPYIRPIIEDSFVESKELPENIEVEESLVKPLPKQVEEPKLNIDNLNKDIRKVEEKLDSVVNSIKELGFNAKIEQYDFENLYQFVIKVDKK